MSDQDRPSPPTSRGFVSIALEGQWDLDGPDLLFRRDGGNPSPESPTGLEPVVPTSASSFQ